MKMPGLFEAKSCDWVTCAPSHSCVLAVPNKNSSLLVCAIAGAGAATVAQVHEGQRGSDGEDDAAATDAHIHKEASLPAFKHGI